MLVYWSMFILAVIFLATAQQKTIPLQASNQGNVNYKTTTSLVVISALYILFFAGFRDICVDTSGYIKNYYAMPTDWNGIFNTVQEQSSGKGFYVLLGFFKMLFFESNHYTWLFFVAGLSLWGMCRSFNHFSCNYALSYYLYVATAAFTYLFNGARQGLALSLLFGFVFLLFDGKQKHFIYYFLIAILCATIHNSAWFVIPLTYVCFKREIFDRYMIAIAILFAISINYMDNVMDAAADIMNKDYTESLDESAGSNIMRLVISFVPSIMVIAKLNTVRRISSPFMKFVINMTFMQACFFLISTFSSGLLIGRMPAYFEPYSFILYPWLFMYVYKQPIVKGLCIFLFGVYFYIQMALTWGGLTYVSYALGISLDLH